MGVLLEALEAAWKAVGLDGLDSVDKVFRQLVIARLIEPTSKQDSLRVLTAAMRLDCAPGWDCRWQNWRSSSGPHGPVQACQRWKKTVFPAGWHIETGDAIDVYPARNT